MKPKTFDRRCEAPLPSPAPCPRRDVRRGPGSARPPRRQRGAAALVVTLLLFLGLALSLVYANRSLLVDSRTALHQTQASQAFEAAEAGVEWMTALLNDPRRLDEDCLVTVLGSAKSQRDRLLAYDASTGLHLPRTWMDGSVPRAVQSACVNSASGWLCSCPSSGPPHPPAGTDATPRPSFIVSLQAGTRPGTVQVNATGCSNRGPACFVSAGEPSEAKAQVETLLALLPAVFIPPATPLTARGDVTVAAAPLTVTNDDPASGGSTIDAGGSFTAPAARLVGLPGASPALSVVEHDAALGALAAERLFARHFGMDKPTWRQRPGTVRITCSSACGSQIDAALANGATLIWIDGDLAVSGAAAWGSATHPVAVVATGEITLDTPTTIHGLVYGRSVVWNNASSATDRLHGALVSETDYRGDGAPALAYDPAVLHALNVDTGSFVRVPGSWKDF